MSLKTLTSWEENINKGLLIKNDTYSPHFFTFLWEPLMKNPCIMPEMSKHSFWLYFLKGSSKSDWCLMRYFLDGQLLMAKFWNQMSSPDHIWIGWCLVEDDSQMWPHQILAQYLKKLSSIIAFFVLRLYMPAILNWIDSKCWSVAQVFGIIIWWKIH